MICFDLIGLFGKIHSRCRIKLNAGSEALSLLLEKLGQFRTTDSLGKSWVILHNVGNGHLPTKLLTREYKWF